jgi:hypothetical protein
MGRSTITKEDLLKYIEISNKLEDTAIDLRDCLGGRFDVSKAQINGTNIVFDIHKETGCNCHPETEFVMSLTATAEILGKEYPYRELESLYAQAIAIEEKKRLEVKENAERRAAEDKALAERKEFERLKAKFGGQDG